MKVIRGKKALVTGAAFGIGRSIALALAREGADLFLIDIDEAGLATVVEEIRMIGVEVIGKTCDVADADQLTASITALMDSWGKLDILVNNAGVFYYGRTERMTEKEWDHLLAVNLGAPIRFTCRLLPILRAQPEAHILNISSVAGLVPARKMAAYQTSKFALVGLSEALRAEYGPYGLGVTVLCPGFVKTKMLDSALKQNRVTEGHILLAFLQVSPDLVAKRAIKAIRKNHRIVVISVFARFLWFLHRYSPFIFDIWGHMRSRRKKH